MPKRKPAPTHKPHQWERNAYWEACGTESDTDADAENIEGRSAGAVLADLLPSLLFAGTLSARTVCIIAFWCMKAGCEGAEVARLSFRPGAPSGHYQRHLDTVLDIDPRKLKHTTDIEVPGYEKHSLCRSVRDTPVQVIHNVLDEEMGKEPLLEEHMGAAVQTKE